MDITNPALIQKISISHQTTSHYIATRQLTKHKKQITPWGLLDDISQGEAIEFAQFEGRKLYRQFPDGFTIFEDLVITKRPFVPPCPLRPIVIWVTVWVSGILSEFRSTI